MLWEWFAEGSYLEFGHYMDGDTPTPIFINQTTGEDAIYGYLGWKIQMVDTDQWTLFRFEGIDGDVGLPLGLLGQFIGSLGLVGSLPDQIISLR